MMIRTIVETRDRPIAVLDVLSKLAQSRILYIDGDITAELANNINSQLIILDSQNQDEITIIINSRGGSVYAGLMILDRMEKIESPVKTIAQGMAMSMAAVILACGDTRVMTKNATVMLHQASNGMWGKVSDLAINFAETNRLNDLLSDIIEDKTLVKREDMKDDFYIDANMALELGIIDKIDIRTKDKKKP